MTVTTALYRRYRPDSFADVIGQEHVTEPLMTALRKNRVNHAYLFSGPRGCGKTTSARILARCLNCAQGPTDTPCGACPSCIELARGGSGSLDVIEIDAASHGGVDDARDLRERATYAPVRDRYKIFIIDEAHMVTSAGFNALLKIVEEPPEHIKFIFATTEPDKVIGTIRSRTHHYPFRLVPPEPLMAYLGLLCRQENVPVAPGVLSLVIRAGAGSVRDSLSVLDQLMAGAGQNGLDYELAVALLGYTHASLLDDVVEAVAASDAATVFRAVDRVIQTGHDPRRFVEDLLERFRDLIIVQAMPESAQTILRGMPADQIARLQNQAHNLGAAELSRAADVTNTALTEMTGATSPRLHLELLCARILLPSSEQTERGIAARIDRVERRLNYAGNDVGAPAPAGSSVPVAGTAPERSAPEPTAPAVVQPPAAAAPQTPAPAAPQTPAPAAARAAEATPAAPASQEAPPREQIQQPQPAEARQPLTAPRVSTSDWPVDEPAGGRTTAGAGVGPAADLRRAPAQESPAHESPSQASPAQAAPVQESPAAAPVPEDRRVAVPAAPAVPAAAAGPGGDVEVLRRAWPEILQTLSKIKRSTWALVEPNAQVAAFDGQGLTLAFSTSGLAGAFGRADHSENLRQAIHKTVGIDCQITAVAGGSNSGNNSPASSEPNPKAPASRVAPPTSADVAWGLAPAGTSPTHHSTDTTQDTAAPLAAAAPAVQAPTAHAPAVPAPAAPAPTAPASTPQSAGPAEAHKAPAPASAQAASPAPAQSSVQAPGPVPAASPVQEADTAGTYAYSDDDWGPPRDEDAPPLEEEPPMDWDPSAPAEPRRTPAAAAAAPGSGGSDLPAGKRAPKTKKAGAAAGGITATAQAAPHDPWTRAVEQAPGVWVVGTETNIGKGQAPSEPDSTSATAASAPHYEPATAQVPQAPEVPQVPAVSQPAATQPAAAPESPESVDPWGLPVAGPVTTPPSPGPGDFGRPSAPESPSPEPVAAPVREYAMAASAPQAAPPQPSPATSPEAAAARQSLYQRLSNSPEAEAGRAKAPSRAVAAAVPDVQDIPSADDETIEESGVFGRAAIERILGGKLIEERSLDGSPLPPRY
ncbi:DNA polymerase III subunit gamma and tau [Arthrobacter sp. BE255]|uniref:DNA polymerase III subunit gamma and tau n=1 Tax=Arthrobacter sp. BE255 TaxID=2817721 RepID=UPI002862760F|nr:DNA polymerase III subunit gamma and tau [Arthrobacter sp. BE255]MDR7160778.1 DNA polymerase-3 subunit gamma/tau [Arthrobacter sp. BE255]